MRKTSARRNARQVPKIHKTNTTNVCAQSFGSLVEYHPITAKDQSRIHQFGKKVLPGLFLGYTLYARGIWKGDVLVGNLEELETMDVSEIYSKRLNAKEVIFPKEKGEFIFPIADRRINTLGEINN